MQRILATANSKIISQKRYQALYPWFVWLLASSFLFYKYVLQVSPSVMTADLMSAFQLNGEGLGNLAACYFYGYLSMQLVVGMLLDRFNAKWLIAFAISICALGAIVFSGAQTWPQAASGRLLIGIGGAFSAVGTMKLISIWFAPKRFALVSGLMMTVGMLGGVGGEAPLANYVNAVGWRDAIYMCGLFGFILAIVFALCVSGTTKTSAKTNEKRSIKHLLQSHQAWLIAIYSGLAFAPISAFAGLWGVPFLMAKCQLDRELSAHIISLIFIGFAIGAPLAGWISDKINRRKPIMIVGTGFSLGLILIILYSPIYSEWLLAGAMLLFGFFTSFFFVSFAMIKEIMPAVLAGSAIGFINTFNALLGAVSEPLIGRVLDTVHPLTDHNFTTSDYSLAFLILPGMLIIALMLQLFIRESYCRSIT